MARHFWRKLLQHQHFDDEVESAGDRWIPPRSALVLEIFWRRIGDGMFTRSLVNCCHPQRTSRSETASADLRLQATTFAIWDEFRNWLGLGLERPAKGNENRRD